MEFTGSGEQLKTGIADDYLLASQVFECPPAESDQQVVEKATFCTVVCPYRSLYTISNVIFRQWTLKALCNFYAMHSLNLCPARDRIVECKFSSLATAAKLQHKKKNSLDYWTYILMSDLIEWNKYMPKCIYVLMQAKEVIDSLSNDL